MSIALAVVILGASIAFHELGHFLAFKLLGCEVERFAVGLGPTPLRWTRGGTHYSIGPMLLGGYVKPREPEHVAWKDFLATAAGPGFSLLLSYLCAVLAVGVSLGGIHPAVALKAFADILGYLPELIGHPSLDSVTGPVGIVQSLAATTDMLDWCVKALLLNLSLALINLLPVPPLDGGGMLLSLLRLLTRRPLHALRLAVTAIGAIILLTLAAIATWHDLRGRAPAAAAPEAPSLDSQPAAGLR